MKEQMRELEELRMSRDEAVNGAKETERKLKAMEAEVLHFQEVKDGKIESETSADERVWIK